jgi:uncharacterized membrane protein YcgQ (UPF0703/DUF1980 family)
VIIVATVILTACSSKSSSDAQGSRSRVAESTGVTNETESLELAATELEDTDKTSEIDEVDSIEESSEAKSVTEGEVKPDLIIPENLYITQLNDIYLNFDEYDGKIVEIEGMKFVYDGYKFVGRYGPGCCANDSVALLEYECDPSLEEGIELESTWIKVTGVLRLGNDGTMDYIYIETISIETPEIRGEETVTS